MDRNKPYSLGLYEKAMPTGFTFRDMFDVIKKCGFDCLEISIDETDMRLSRLDWPCEKKSELALLSREMQVPIKTMCLSGHRKYPFGSHDAQIRERSLDIMKKAVDFSSQIGISVIQLAGYDVYYERHDEKTKVFFEEGLRKAVEYAASCGVVLAFETMETPFMDTVKKAMYYVNVISSPWLGTYPDIGNLQNAAVLYGTDVITDLTLGRGHIFAMHLKETRPGKYRDMRFGTGHTRYAECLKCAVDTGVRMFTGEFWYQSGQNYMDEILYSAKFLRGVLDEAFCEAPPALMNGTL